MGVYGVQRGLRGRLQIRAQSHQCGSLADRSRDAALLPRPPNLVQHARGPRRACGPGCGTADVRPGKAHHGRRVLMTWSSSVQSFPSAVPVPRRQPQAPSLLTRLDQLGRTLRPTPHVPLAVEHMNVFAKLEYVNPVGSIKDRPAYWILKRAAERGEICDETTVIESSSGNFASALAAFTRLVGLKFIPVIDPNISGTY